jgi:hypothetical protein
MSFIDRCIYLSILLIFYIPSNYRNVFSTYVNMRIFECYIRMIYLIFICILNLFIDFLLCTLLFFHNKIFLWSLTDYKLDTVKINSLGYPFLVYTIQFKKKDYIIRQSVKRFSFSAHFFIICCLSLSKARKRANSNNEIFSLIRRRESS